MRVIVKIIEEFSFKESTKLPTKIKLSGQRIRLKIFKTPLFFQDISNSFNRLVDMGLKPCQTFLKKYIQL